MRNQQTLTICKYILEQARAKDFAGYDPFDGLNSKLFDFFPKLRSSLLGLAWIQFFKRSIINFRPLFLVPEKRNPKGVALFILGLLHEYSYSKDRTLLEQSEALAEWLLLQKCSGDEWEYACWGYHFDWKARAFFVPKGKPNVITTIYVAQALYELSLILEESKPDRAEKYRSTAFEAADFIVNKLLTKVDGRIFFAYIPGETAFVHNASLWAAAWVAKVAAKTANEHYRSISLQVAHQSVKEQGSDGSWVYGARHHHQFIDGFHTGYNLEALDEIRRSLGVDEFDEVIAKGLVYYKDNFFTEQGAAKYYNNNAYPLDMHSVSQAVLTLLKVGGEPDDLVLAEKVIAWSIDNLYLKDKQRFIYQKTERFSNSINYIRWTQAWVYYAFSFYNHLKVDHHEAN